jgi:hypothetical protein
MQKPIFSFTNGSGKFGAIGDGISSIIAASTPRNWRAHALHSLIERQFQISRRKD